MSEDEFLKNNISSKEIIKDETDSLKEPNNENKKDSIINIDNSNININNNKDYTYGNYKILYKDEKGNPLFLIGPDVAYFEGLLILDIVYLGIIISLYIFIIKNWIIRIIGLIIYCIQFFFS